MTRRRPAERRTAPQWTRIRCGLCTAGTVSDYDFGGTEFYGPKDCPECEGTGFLWQSPKGRLAVYPGGPFRGRA